MTDLSALSVAVIGVGVMGSAIATRLLETNARVAVFDPDAAKMRALADRGARPALAAADAEVDWRRVVALAVDRGVATPAFSSTLAYCDGLRWARGPANLLQGLRDYFGAHAYRRLDKPGVFHTRWGQDGEEVAAA
jgi:6-phosphogluconate dehydrogenase